MGGAARRADTKALECHGTFISATQKGVTRAEACIHGMFLYIANQKSPKAGNTKTEALPGGRGMLYARLHAKGFQDSTGSNASAPTSRLQSLSVVRAVIASRKWNSREMDVSISFLNRNIKRAQCM